MHLNENVWLRWLDYISYFLYYSHKAGNLHLCWPIVSFGKDDSSYKEKYWLHQYKKWLAFLWESLVEGCIEDSYVKIKLFGYVKVYLKDFLWIVIYKYWWLTQGIIDWQKKCKLLRYWGPKVCLQSVGSALLVIDIGVIEKWYFELLQRHCQLDIEVYIALQVSRKAWIILQDT